MDKESSVISWIKNRILSIISRLKERNIEPGVIEEKEQPVDSEPISRSENKTKTHSPDKKELIGLKKELGESIDAILNRLFDGISGLLEEEYKDRLIGLEGSIEELKKKEEEQVVSDLKAYKELEKVRTLAETAKLSSEGNIEKIEKIAAEELEIEELKGKIEELREISLTNIPAYKSKGTTTVSDYTKQAPEGAIGTINGLEKPEIEKLEEKIEKMIEMKLSDIPIEKIMKIGPIIEKMKQDGKDIPKEDDLEKVFFSKRLAALISAEDREPLKQPLPDSMTAKEVFERIVEEASKPEKLLKEIRKELKLLKRFEIESSYQRGISLLKKEAYKDAKECFEEIITMNPNLKGAWLNRGVASGELGDFKEEIACYNIALRKDNYYKKALHNKKIAERKMKRTE